MILFKRAADLARWLREQRSTGKQIGFVPTMGALHAGHISLIDISKKAASVTVCSIFVNPTQFNDPKDFQKYPITIEKDIYLLEKAGTDALFLPESAELYPGGTKDLENYDLGSLEQLLEGKYRPGHFQGVCQVVRRLLDIVQPDHLFMGQKDYQQCMVVRRLLEITGSAVQLHPCPIVREPDGLAMSSRNMRLSEKERKNATAIFSALSTIREMYGSDRAKPDTTGSQHAVREIMIGRAGSILEQHDFRIDYVEIADIFTLEPVMQWTGQEKLIALVAAFQGEVRLIDNMIL
jgi:pantoate--beta-alanine ligase